MIQLPVSSYQLLSAIGVMGRGCEQLAAGDWRLEAAATER